MTDKMSAISSVVERYRQVCGDKFKKEQSVEFCFSEVGRFIAVVNFC